MSGGMPSGLLPHLMESARADGWREVLHPFRQGHPPDVALHLAILVEPYLSFILDGQKTVESRFSNRAAPPYQRLEPGDVVLLKHASGPIVGAFTAAAVWFYRLDPNSWRDLRAEFATALCAQSGFWEERATASFATLVRVSDVKRLPPVTVPKRDRRGWVVLTHRSRQGELL